MTSASGQPAYETARRVTDIATVVLAENPSVMTLEGTNTWLLRAPGADECVVVDPGVDTADHLDAVLDAAGTVALVLLTHGHSDHTTGAAELHARTGAPVRAADGRFCIAADPLTGGEQIRAAGLDVSVLATPGHTADSVSFVPGLEGQEPVEILTGDTILGRGTTVVAHPDGVLGAYLETLDLLVDQGALRVLPGHGPELGDLAKVATAYRAHRAQRLDQVRRAVADRPVPVSVRELVEQIYAQENPAVWGAAERSMRAQLDYLGVPFG